MIIKQNLLTRKQFIDHWNRDFAPLTNEIMPSYDEFIISERMLEDYLDIFRGFNSRDGNIDMPYNHPFFDAEGNPLLSTKPSIKYILIGEARPQNVAPSLNECNGDFANTYFYNINHVGMTPWLNAPRLNWGCPQFWPCPNDKIQTLLCLASNGVLLLDIFPFAIQYGPIRTHLNMGGVTRNYWDHMSNTYSLSNRINTIASLLSKDWDLSLIAPCKISGHIINPINAFPPISSIPAGLHPIQFTTMLPNPTRCSLGGDWRKVAVTSAGAPSQHLINISF